MPVASEVADKRRENKILRRRAKDSVVRSEYESRPMPIMKEVSDPWNRAKEGKLRFAPKADPKRMRK